MIVLAALYVEHGVSCFEGRTLLCACNGSTAVLFGTHIRTEDRIATVI